MRMAVTVNGKNHRTMKEAAPIFGVTEKTVYSWIAKGIIPEPPRVLQGLKRIMVFPDSYIETAKQKISRLKT